MTRVSDAVDLGRLVRLRRREERETQQRLADVCGVGRGSVAKLERGDATVQLGIVLRLVAALGLKCGGAPAQRQRCHVRGGGSGAGRA
jgi:HTH-type transcriptional regulator/antitoxin HipB